MADLTQDQIEKILSTVVDIYTEQDIVSSNALDSTEINGDKIIINIVLNYPHYTRRINEGCERTQSSRL
jgi:ATP-binding protein involved in chromosome partitioning